LIDAARNWFASLTGYDALNTRGRRKAAVTRVKSEDAVLEDRGRRQLQATAQDVQRNFSIAAWAIRMHLNYVSSFAFQSRTGDDQIDEAVEAYMAGWSSRYQCDVRRQHPFRRMIRLAEARRVVDGDFFFLKVSGDGPNRGRLQAIEGDRVATAIQGVPSNFNATSWTNGVKLTPSGVAREYCICNRDNSGNLSFGRIVPADSVFSHGFYDRFDQVRGVSPIAAALNSLQDVYEGIDYALAKIKVSQLFGLVFYREAADGFDGVRPTIDSNGDGIADSGYEVDFANGPQMLDLNPGDRAEFLESRSPATETVQFLKLIIHVALKSLDLPYSFFDESFTNFYGSRGSMIQYLKACRAKQQDLSELLDEIASWRLGMAIADGDLVLPPGVSFQDLSWEWVPDGVPWWDPQKEVSGHASAIAAGLDTPQRVCRAIGTDYYDNIDEIAKANTYAKERGVNIVLPGISTAQVALERQANADPGSREDQGST
jgi:capsid protein